MKIKQFVNNPFQENTYIIWDETSGDAAIVDCGALFENEYNAIDSFIQDNHLNLVHLLNTHLHLDHCFGNHHITAKYGIKPEAHHNDAPFISRFDDQLSAFGLPLKVPAQPIGKYLDDSTSVNIGNIKLDIIHTPGHTPGGICFYNAANNILFTGDTLFNGSVGRADLEGGSYSDLINSIRQRLLPLPDSTVVYCGHGPYTTIGDERKSNPFL